VELDLDQALEDADVVMPLRMQLERQEGGRVASLRQYTRDYGVTEVRLRHVGERAIVMHPGPMNEGIEIDPVVAHGPRSVVNAQVANGVAVRMAVLYLLLASSASSAARGRDERRGTDACEALPVDARMAKEQYR
jgi:aspartate carbamoyltransferase catalytic subunit